MASEPKKGEAKASAEPKGKEEADSDPLFQGCERRAVKKRA
ncbi:MAG: hypothetical protein LKKZDAJK_001463 [Candidatus Fervidibacter sp.]